MKKIIILTILLFTSIFVNAQYFEWAKQIGGTGTVSGGKSIAVDALGNVYTTGYFSGQVDFDPSIGVFNLTSAGSIDIFITKFDALGSFLWAKRIGGTSGDQGNSIDVDNFGNLYVTGNFQDTVDFNPGASVFNLLTSINTNNSFVLKLNSNGNFIWAKQLGKGGTYCNGNSIALDGNGNVYTIGEFNGIADFDPGTGTFNLAPSGNGDVYISKLNINGDFLWVKKIGGASNDDGTSIVVDKYSNVYTTGTFNGTVDFNPGTATLNLTGFYDVFISKLDSLGNYVWAKQIGGANIDRGKSIAVDNSGNVIVSGEYKDTVDFDPGPGIFNLTKNTSFVCKLNNMGNFVWAKSAAGPQTVLNYIALDTIGNVYSTGYFSSTQDFDPGIGTFNLTTGYSYQSMFISKLDTSGNFVWANAVKAIANTSIRSDFIIVDSNKDIYTTGYFEGTYDFNPDSSVYNLTSVGTDVFVLKLNQNCSNISTPTASDKTICSGKSATLTANGSNSYAWYSVTSGGTKLSSFASFTTPNLSATTTYYVENIFNGCTSSRTPITVTVNPSPTTPTAIGTSVCSGQSATLTTSGGTTYAWYTVSFGGSAISTTASFTTPPLTTNTTYYVENIIGTCTSSRKSVMVTVNSSLIPITNGVSICIGSSASLTANGGTNYAWYSDSTGGSVLSSSSTFITPILTSNTTYYVENIENGCTSARKAVLVTVKPIPNPPLTTNTNICSGQTATLTVAAGSIYRWYTLPSGGSFVSTSANFTTPTLSTTTTYYVETILNGCTSARSAVTVSVNTVTPQVSFGPTICAGNTANLSVSGGSTYAWYSVASGGTEISTSANFTTPTLTSTTTYYIEAILNGCTSARESVTVTVTPIPNADFTANGNDLTATPSGLSYQWLLSGTPIVGANSSTYSILQDGSYSVIVTDGTCADTSAVQNIVYLALSNKTQTSLSIYPNPAHSSIFVQNKSNEIYKVEMMDVLGHNIKSFVINSDLSEFELAGLSTGLYFLKFTNQQNETFYHKFIKE